MFKLFHPLSILSILLGIGSFVMIGKLMDTPENHKISEQCKANPPSKTGVKLIDIFLCTITPFFEEELSTPEGLLAWNMTSLAAKVFLFFLCVEGLRAKSTGLVRFPALFALIGQVGGIGPTALLFFIPAYIYSSSSSSSSSSSKQTSSKRHGHGHGHSHSNATVLSGLYSTLAFVLLFTAVALVMTALPPTTVLFSNLNAIVRFFPILLFWTPIFRLFKTSPVSTTLPVVQAGYLLLGGMNFAFYYYGLGNLYAQRVLSNSSLSIFDVLSKPNESFNFNSVPVLVLVVDFAGFYLVPIFVLIQDRLLSFFDLIGFLLASVVLSPGTAFAIYFARREEKFEHNKVHEN